MLVTFEDNYRFLGDLPFVIYFDFETTAGSDLFQDVKTYVIRYCLMFAFHPKLDIERIVIYRSFQQNEEQLFDLSHLKPKMLQFLDSVTLNQIKDIGLKVYEKKSSLLFHKCALLNLKLQLVYL